MTNKSVKTMCDMQSDVSIEIYNKNRKNKIGPKSLKKKLDVKKSVKYFLTDV
jgi:hypothetical protein